MSEILAVTAVGALVGAVWAFYQYYRSGEGSYLLLGTFCELGAGLGLIALVGLQP